MKSEELRVNSEELRETLTRFGFVVTATIGNAVIPSEHLCSARDLMAGINIEILLSVTLSSRANTCVQRGILWQGLI